MTKKNNNTWRREIRIIGKNKSSDKTDFNYVHEGERKVIIIVSYGDIGKWKLGIHRKF